MKHTHQLKSALQTGVVISCALMVQSLFGETVSDLGVLFKRAAAYESGASTEPLREIERLLNASVNDAKNRAELEEALILLLATEATFEAKRFGCKQLAVYGSLTALPALENLLKQEDTVGMACLALGGMRSPKAGDVLRNALPGSQGTALLQIVGSLGNRAEPDSVKPLESLVRDPDTAVACAAIRALGSIDAPSARNAVAALRREAKPSVAAAVAEASLNGAGQLAAAGDRKAAAALCGELLKTALPTHLRRGAFGLLLRCQRDGGAELIAELLVREPVDPSLAAVAISRVPELRGWRVSRTFGKLLDRLQPEQQALLIEALACRGDSSARAAIRKQAVAVDAQVRLAAFAAMGRTEDDDAVPVLAAALARAASPDETKAIELALAGLRGGRKTDKAICAALHAAGEGAAKMPLMDVLARRGGRAAVSELLACAGSEDKNTSRAATQALTRIADSGDSASLATLCEAVTDGDVRTREAALRALAAWRGIAAWETLQKIYTETENAEEHALALRGLVRIAGEGNAHPDTALIGRYRQLLEGARNDEDRKQIVCVLAGVAHPDALALARPLLDVDAVRAEAVQAVERISEAIKNNPPN